MFREIPFTPLTFNHTAHGGAHCSPCSCRPVSGGLSPGPSACTDRTSPPDAPSQAANKFGIC